MVRVRILPYRLNDCYPKKVVALCSFVLSFESLRSSAVEARFDPLLARVAGRYVLMPSSFPGPLVLRGNSPGVILGLRMGCSHYLHRNQYRVQYCSFPKRILVSGFPCNTAHFALHISGSTDEHHPVRPDKFL
mgnify:CR=1 FL=1